MPEHLDDAINNSEPWRHSLMCVNCGETIRASSPLGVRLKMRFHRNHKCAKNVRKAKEMATAQEMGARLAAMADEISRTMSARQTAISEDLNAMLEQLAGCKQTVENPTNEVAQMLGEDHPGTNSIVGGTAEVDDRLDSIYNAMLLVVREMETLPAVVSQLAFTYTQVGAAVAGGHI